MSTFNKVLQEWNDRRREHEQLSAAEVPGFHARTVIDDTIGKLYALRCHLKTDMPDGIQAMLDEIEELVEAVMEIAFDPDAAPVLIAAPDHLRGWSPALADSGSHCLGECSCGGLFLSDTPPLPSVSVRVADHEHTQETG